MGPDPLSPGLVLPIPRLRGHAKFETVLRQIQDKQASFAN